MTDPTDSAVARTFAIVEVTEKILLNTDFIDVLRCQRVSKHVGEVIKGSLALQQKLHLAPESATGDDEKRLLPILPTYFTTPLLIPAHQLDKFDKLPKGNAWKKYLLIQAPNTNMTCFLVCGECRATVRNMRFAVNNHDGITVGDVYKAGEAAFTLHCNEKGCNTGAQARRAKLLRMPKFQIVLQQGGATGDLVRERRLALEESEYIPYLPTRKTLANLSLNQTPLGSQRRR